VVGVPGAAGEVIVAELVDIFDVRLLPDLGQHRAGKDLGAENGWHFLLLELLDQRRHLLWGWVLERRHLDRPDDLPLVVGREIRVCVVVGQQLPVMRRHVVRRRLEPLIKVVDLGLEFRCVGLVVVGVGRVGLRQHAGCDYGVAAGHGGVGPQVWVRFPAAAGEGEIVDVLVGAEHDGAQLDDLARRGDVLLGQVLGRILE